MSLNQLCATKWAVYSGVVRLVAVKHNRLLSKNRRKLDRLRRLQVRGMRTD